MVFVSTTGTMKEPNMIATYTVIGSVAGVLAWIAVAADKIQARRDAKVAK